MAFRIHEIEVPEDDPFKNDVLHRKEIVEFLAKLLGRTTGPFVLAIDAEWGTGKTTLVTMLQAVLRSQKFQCVQFNAWKTDYVVDPLVPMVSTISQIQLPQGDAASTFRERVKLIKKGTGVIAKRTAIAGVKAATFGILDVGSDFEKIAAELAGDTAKDIVERFEQETEILEKFRADLESAVLQLEPAGKKSNLIFFIDELDRCRPDFAIALLERIKHLFDVNNIVFVLSIDKKQLEASVAAVYGIGINAAEYLRRFIDLEFGVPAIDGKPFTEMLLKRVGLEEVFAQRTGNSELRYDRDHFIQYFTLLADVCQLTLRARERCATRMILVMDQTASNHYLDPIIVAVLLVVRTVKPNLFKQIADGIAGATEVMEHLRSLPGAEKLFADRMGSVIEAEMLAAEPDRQKRDANLRELESIAQDEARSDTERKKAREIVELMSYTSRNGRRPSIKWVAGKIDLAALTRDRG